MHEAAAWFSVSGKVQFGIVAFTRSNSKFALVSGPRDAIFSGPTFPIEEPCRLIAGYEGALDKVIKELSIVSLLLSPL